MKDKLADVRINAKLFANETDMDLVNIINNKFQKIIGNILI